MAKTAAERMRESRERKRNQQSATAAAQQASATEQPIGNWCKACGKDTGHKLVVKCLQCCTSVQERMDMPGATVQSIGAIV